MLTSSSPFSSSSFRPEMWSSDVNFSRKNWYIYSSCQGVCFVFYSSLSLPPHVEREVGRGSASESLLRSLIQKSSTTRRIGCWDRVSCFHPLLLPTMFPLVPHVLSTSQSSSFSLFSLSSVVLFISRSRISYPVGHEELFAGGRKGTSHQSQRESKRERVWSRASYKLQFVFKGVPKVLFANPVAK